MRKTEHIYIYIGIYKCIGNYKYIFLQGGSVNFMNIHFVGTVDCETVGQICWTGMSCVDCIPFVFFTHSYVIFSWIG